jgi:hypothetical protein
MVCSGVDDPDRCILCDRCNSEVHFRCTDPPITDVPSGAWICPICRVEAPLSTEYIATRNNELAEKAESKQTPPRWSAAEDRLLMQLLRDNFGIVTRSAFKVLDRTHQAMRSRHKHIHMRSPSLIPSMERFRVRGEEGKSVVTDEELHACLVEIDRMHAKAERAASSSEMVKRELKGTSGSQSSNAMSAASAGPNSTSNGTGKVQQSLSQGQQPKKANGTVEAKKDEAKKISSDVKKPQTTSTPGLRADEKRRTELLGAIFSDSFQALEQRRKETADEEELVRQRKKALGQRQWVDSPDHCFICWRPGAEIQCGDPWCDRAYHSFCLGSRAPKGLVDTWVCPWHYCAACSALGTQVTPAFLPESARETKVPTVEEAAGTVRWRSAEISPQKAVEAQGLGGDDSPTKLYRCCGCPLALCTSHLCVSMEVVFVLERAHSGSVAASAEGSDGIQDRWSVGIERQASEFIACERCAGLPRLARLPGSDDGGDYQHLPRVELARTLDQFLSEFVDQNKDLVRFALRLPSKEMVRLAAGDDNVDSFFALVEAGVPLSLDRLQRKVRLMSYASAKAFQVDFLRMAETLATLYEASQIKLAAGARTFRDVKAKMDKRGFSSAILRADERSKQDEMLFRRVYRDTPSVRNDEALQIRGLTPWETYERFNVGERTSVEAEERLEQWSAAAFKEATFGNGERGALQVLFEASRMARMVNYLEERQELLLGPSREEVEAAFEAHMDHIRGAMMTGAILRNQLGRVLDVVESVDPSVFELHKPVLTIGGNRPIEEQRAANRALQARLNEARGALVLERQARAELEQKVKRLEKRQRLKAVDDDDEDPEVEEATTRDAKM